MRRLKLWLHILLLMMEHMLLQNIFFHKSSKLHTMYIVLNLNCIAKANMSAQINLYYSHIYLYLNNLLLDNMLFHYMAQLESIFRQIHLLAQCCENHNKKNSE